MMRSLSSLPSILLGAIATILLSSTATAQHAASSNPASNNLASGSELLNEMRQLQTALVSIQSLIDSADIPAEDEIMSKATKLIRRVRTLVHATNFEMGMGSLPVREDDITQRRAERRAQRTQTRQMLRGGIGSGEVEEIMGQQEQQEAIEESRPEVEDDVARKLYDATLTFPECKEQLLEFCIQILNRQLIELQMEAEFIVHAKRDQHQDGYYKVVLITDLTATNVKGKNNDGIVNYPFLWDDAVIGYARVLGVEGKWDCHAHTPEACCQLIQESCPNPDTKGNMLQCHIFVPYGGVGNSKRDNRIFINLSPDGRVQESPFIS
mmetsp:Transcript_15043/g.27218  ORF Transcript_15043/g.27218 Transcript_15043/m.27218 type:complete len:324 (-) Transcript_15043:106-1077(-)